tara:strand:+ start:1483 stop:1860 length:378 start_codon:yes stop_codon:yes gene_type:complete
MTDNKRAIGIIAAYEKRIKKEMSFWIKHRPSCWWGVLPEKLVRILLRFIKTKGVKNFLIIFSIFLSFIFVGFVPTLSFIWSNIFKLWLTLLLIPIIYWSVAITSVYTVVLAQVVCEFVRGFLNDS